MKRTQIKETQKPACRTQDIVWDIKYAMSELYWATFVENGDELKILFENGDEFSVLVKRR